MQLIQSAETFFIGSGYNGQVCVNDIFCMPCSLRIIRQETRRTSVGMDCSHRGGPRGFVKVTRGNTLAWKDFSGNNHVRIYTLIAI
jgi:hypothetical protein